MDTSTTSGSGSGSGSGSTSTSTSGSTSTSWIKSHWVKIIIYILAGCIIIGIILAITKMLNCSGPICKGLGKSLGALATVLEGLFSGCVPQSKCSVFDTSDTCEDGNGCAWSTPSTKTDSVCVNSTGRAPGDGGTFSPNCSFMMFGLIALFGTIFLKILSYFLRTTNKSVKDTAEITGDKETDIIDKVVSKVREADAIMENKNKDRSDETKETQAETVSNMSANAEEQKVVQTPEQMKNLAENVADTQEKIENSIENGEIKSEDAKAAEDAAEAVDGEPVDPQPEPPESTLLPKFYGKGSAIQTLLHGYHKYGMKFTKRQHTLFTNNIKRRKIKIKQTHRLFLNEMGYGRILSNTCCMFPVIPETICDQKSCADLTGYCTCAGNGKCNSRSTSCDCKTGFDPRTNCSTCAQGYEPSHTCDKNGEHPGKGVNICIAYPDGIAPVDTYCILSTKHTYNCIQTFPEKDVVPCQQSKCVSNGGIKRSCVIADDGSGTYASLDACQTQCVATEGQTCDENPNDDEWCANCSTDVFGENCDEVCASFNRTQYAVEDASGAFMKISDHTTGVEGSLKSWKNPPWGGCWQSGCSCFPKSPSGSKFDAGVGTLQPKL